MVFHINDGYISDLKIIDLFILIVKHAEGQYVTYIHLNMVILEILSKYDRNALEN